MKTIHSFWSKPSFHGNQNFQNSRKFGGWLSYKYFLLSTCFSCLSIKRHQKKIDLYTDTRGYEIFINQLGLPYDDVSLVLDQLEEEDHRLWVLGKLKVIKLQEKPFVHVDNDVFIWEALSAGFLQKPLVAQSKHLMPNTYKSNLKGVLENFGYIPSCLNKVPAEDALIANIGVIGGTDVDFFQEYCETAYGLLERNLEHIPKINVGGFNQILDEYLFTCLAQEKKSDIQYLIDNIHCMNPNIEPYDHVLRFHLVPLIDRYIHVVGLAKQNKYACEQLELRFKYEFPEYYKVVSKAIQEFYPALVAGEDPTAVKRRKRKLQEAIHKIYTCDMAEIEKMKVQLTGKLQITELSDGSGPDTQYAAWSIDPITGEEAYQELKGADKILAYFDSPLSIQELLEEIRKEDDAVNEEELEQLRLKLISIVLEKICVVGQLEFVG